MRKRCLRVLGGAGPSTASLAAQAAAANTWATALMALVVLASGPVLAGNSPTLPALRFSTWKIAGTGASLVTIGDSTRFTLQTTGAEMYQRIGGIWHMLDPTTEQGWESSWSWPGGRTFRLLASSKNERYGSVSRKQGFGGACRNWVPPSKADSIQLAGFVDARVLRPQPFVVVQGFRGDGSWGTMGALDAAQIQRWLPPQTIVNGVVLNDQTTTFGTVPGSPSNMDGEANYGVVRGVIDPTLVSQRAIYNLFRYQIGVDYAQIVHSYTAGPDADYLLYEMTFFNTGNMSRRPPPLGITHKLPLQDFWFAYMFHGKQKIESVFTGNDNDLLFEWYNPWPLYTDGSGNRHTMLMFYDGDRPGAPEDWGYPGFSVNDALGMDLWSKQYTAIGWLFAETAPGSGVDDLTAPQGTSWCRERVFNLNGFSGDMKRQYEAWFCQGNADDVPRRQPEGVIQTLVLQPTPYQGLHWSTFPYLATARAVMVVAAGGINDQLSRSMAKTMIRRLDTGVTPVQTPAEIALIQSGKDSVKKVVDRAFWNIYGYDPNPPGGTPRWWNKPVAYKTAMNVPDPPRPPTCAWMTSGDGRIDLVWTPLSDADEKDPDTGVKDFAGYRVYRAAGSPDSDYVLVYEGPDTRFVDVMVSKDFVYYYQVASYDDGTQNWSNPGVKLESGRFWLWNGWNDTGVLPSVPGAVAPTGHPPAFSLAQNVPNPFNPSTTIRFDVPSNGHVELAIYGTNGQLVRVLVDGPLAAGGHAVTWDGTNAAGRACASGVYLCRLEYGRTRGAGEGRSPENASEVSVRRITLAR